ncbi:MAG: BON domain-containing protein [Pseudomonadota bacterium]
MKSSALLIGAAALALLGSAVAVAEDGASATTTAKTIVKDSAITTKIKAKLAAESPSSLARIHVDTDDAGVVWLSGSAKTQSDVDQAIAIAKGTEDVKSVRSEIVVKP